MQIFNFEECDDGNQTNNDGCSAVCRKEALFQITGQRVFPAVLYRGLGPFQYVVRVKNTNKTATTNMSTSVPLPAGFTLNTPLTTGGCKQSGTQVICSDRNFVAGATREYVLGFTVPAYFCGPVVLRVNLTSDRTWPFSSTPVTDVVLCQ